MILSNCVKNYKLYLFFVILLFTILSINIHAQDIVVNDYLLDYEADIPEGIILEGEWVYDGSEATMSKSLFKVSPPVELSSDSKITQFLLINKESEPSGVMIKLFLDKDDYISLYWENDKEVFADLNEYITAWYMGPVPGDSQWRALRIDCKEFELDQENLKRIEFLVNDGEIVWGKTVIEK